MWPLAQTAEIVYPLPMTEILKTALKELEQLEANAPYSLDLLTALYADYLATNEQITRHLSLVFAIAATRESLFAGIGREAGNQQALH